MAVPHVSMDCPTALPAFEGGEPMFDQPQCHRNTSRFHRRLMGKSVCRTKLLHSCDVLHDCRLLPFPKQLRCSTTHLTPHTLLMSCPHDRTARPACMLRGRTSAARSPPPPHDQSFEIHPNRPKCSQRAQHEGARCLGAKAQAPCHAHLILPGGQRPTPQRDSRSSRSCMASASCAAHATRARSQAMRDAPEAQTDKRTARRPNRRPKLP